MLPIFKYGDLVEDRITGVLGTITGFANYYEREPNCYLVDYKTENGELCRNWISEYRLIRIEESEDK